MTVPAWKERPLADLMRTKKIVDGLTPEQLEAWLGMGSRMADGMPPAEAEALMWAELAAAEETL